MLVPAHDLVTAALVYFSIGSGVWVLLEGLGVVDSCLEARRQRGKPAPSGAVMMLAIGMAIVSWPVFVLAMVLGIVTGLLRGARS